MTIIIITQEDSFVIPKNIEKIINTHGMTVIAIVSIKSKSSLVNKKLYFLKGFGFIQSFKMGIHFLYNKAYDYCNLLTRTRLLSDFKSMKSVAHKYNIPYLTTNNPNSNIFISKVLDLKPQILVSFSAPIVFKENLLKTVPMGCINLHCSYLPKYAGIMPSFWVLFNGEDTTGVSVHYMDNKIDNGPILAQQKIHIYRGMSMFDLIKQTKFIGGDLMCSVLKKIELNTHTTHENKIENGSYFSWPSISEMKKFRENGGKFI